jgi:hypothetical protein
MKSTLATALLIHLVRCCGGMVRLTLDRVGDIIIIRCNESRDANRHHQFPTVTHQATRLQLHGPLNRTLWVLNRPEGCSGNPVRLLYVAKYGPEPRPHVHYLAVHFMDRDMVANRKGGTTNLTTAQG